MDNIKIEPLENNDDLPSILWVENTNSSRAWYTADENCVSLVTEDTNKIIKLETDVLIDCSWQSFLEISKETPLQNNDLLLHNTTEYHIQPSDQNTKNSGSSQKPFNCDVCGENFKLNFGLNRHIKKCHPQQNKCVNCDLYFETEIETDQHMKSVHNEVKKDNKSSSNLSIKLQKTNGVWQSKLQSCHSCNVCSKEFLIENDLKQHMSTHQNSHMKKQCQICLENFSNNDLMIHMQQAHGNNKIFKCKNCNIKFSDESYLNCHLEHCTKKFINIWEKFKSASKNTEINIENKCNVCNKICTTPHYLKLHSRKHLNIKPHKCKFCHESFFLKRHLLRHVRLNHNKVTKHFQHFNFHKNSLSNDNICLSENETFNANNSSNNQLEFINNSCSESDQNKTFSKVVKQEDEEQKNDACSYLVFDGLFNKSNIKTENNINSSVSSNVEKVKPKSLPTFECTLCKEPFFCKHGYALHLSYHSTLCKARPLECIGCEIQFHSDLELKQHMEYHKQNFKLSNNSNSIKPNNSLLIVCEICGKRNRNWFQMFIHHRSHTGFKPFQCNLCDSAFSCQSNLFRHQYGKHNILKKSVSKLMENLNRMNHDVDLIANNNILNSIEVKNEIIATSSTNDSTVIKSIRPKRSCTSLDKTLSIHSNNELVPPKVIVKLFECRYCSQTFSSKGCCTNHEKSHTHFANSSNSHDTNKFEEVVQNKNVISNPDSTEEANLISTDIHTINKVVFEDKSIICPKCNKTFENLYSLKKHMTYHVGLRPYKCRYCEMTFKNSGNRGRHEKTHLSNLKYEYTSTTIDVPKTTNYNPTMNTSENFNKILIKNCSVFVCDVCDENYSNPLQLFDHRKSTHPDIKPCKCSICGKLFTWLYNWRRHLITHSSKNQKENCYYYMTNSKPTSKHRAKPVLNSSNIMYKCRHCKNGYKKISYWHSHLLKSKECRRHCNRNMPEFATKEAEKRFLKSQQWICDICNGSYSCSSNYWAHRRNIHNLIEKNGVKHTVKSSKRALITRKSKVIITANIKKSHCELCGMIFNSRNTFLKHRSRKHPELKDNTDIKNKEKKSSINKEKSPIHFKNWKQREIEPASKNIDLNHSCGECGKKFIYLNSLKNHKKTHKKNSVNEVYECKDCGQKFDTNAALGMHILDYHVSNSIQKPVSNSLPKKSSSNKKYIKRQYKCEICSRVYNNFKLLISHKKCHSSKANKMYKCNKCVLSFSSSGNYWRHMRNKHGK
ncbi:zinc finger protein 729-like [Daktulosphaira vitifoliae]|uniref:zinc finger protein 729-like n=1 Tax=Daktulosphaira vitifoliae TaxID=58002 RepID=UPI0021AA3011|nr:zinc finger protein 729-like [Daktulosphaira vitifoliae]